MDLRVMQERERVHGALYRGIRVYKGLVYRDREGHEGNHGEIMGEELDDSKGRVLKKLWKEKEKVTSKNRINKEDEEELK